MFYPIEKTFSISDFYYFVTDRTFPPDFNFAGEKHDFWELVYVIHGKLEVTEDENVYVLGENDIIFHAPNEFHRLRSADNTSPRVFNLSFRVHGELPEVLKNGVLSLSPKLHNEYMEITDMLLRFMAFQKDPTVQSPSAFEISCRLSAFMMRLTRESNTKDSFSTTSGASTYRAVAELMHKEVCNNLSLEEFATRSFISVSYLKKLFCRYAGISPKSYYINLRVAQAQQLLKTNTPIYLIAEKMNFSSAGYFTIFFKKQTGYTPAQYRKRVALN